MTRDIQERISDGQLLWLGNYARPDSAESSLILPHSTSTPYNHLRALRQEFGRDNVVVSLAYDPENETVGREGLLGVYVTAAAFHTAFTDHSKF